MKFKISIISFLLFVSSVFGAVHELEHIDKNHNSSMCQVCVLDHNSISFDITDAKDFYQTDLYLRDIISLKTDILNKHIKKTNNHANAPPQIS
ncbi:MAG: hypothetical protein JXQ66_00305 [Campylobacterales bacterium]|nr:hypothetical protein [Campylobacterales bacterium]